MLQEKRQRSAVEILGALNNALTFRRESHRSNRPTKRVAEANLVQSLSASCHIWSIVQRFELNLSQRILAWKCYLITVPNTEGGLYEKKKKKGPYTKTSLLLLHQTTSAIMANVRKMGTNIRITSVSSGGSTHTTCSMVQLEKKCLWMRMM